MTWLEVPCECRRSMELGWRRARLVDDIADLHDGLIRVTAKVLGGWAIIRVINPCECEQFAAFFVAQDSPDCSNIPIQDKAEELFESARVDLANYRFDMAMLAEMEEQDALAEVLGW